MKKYCYQIFSPGGNDTALVLGLENDICVRKYINDEIMERFPNIEQVGFLSTNLSEPTLYMAGGEFCGNATRSAAWYYLAGTQGELYLKVSGVNKMLRAGVNEEHQAWTQMPVLHDLHTINEIENGFFLVRMEGINHVVVMPEESEKFIKIDCDLKEIAKRILEKYQLSVSPAAGVVFLENTDEGLKIHPCVYVLGVDTMFYETACGSGSIAVGLVMALKQRKNIKVSLIQPSLKIITAIVECCGTVVENAFILGEIGTDNIIYRG